jgi:GntR family transcriptional regulator/MocR family aminotransferase
MDTILNLPIVLDDNLNTPLYEQLSHSLREAINSGKIADGTVLDSTRNLSRKLGISRQTILKSVDVLQSQGYLTASNGRLTAVAACAPNVPTSEVVDAQPGMNPPVPLSQFAEQFNHQPDEPETEWDESSVDGDSLPYKQWNRLMFKHVRLVQHKLDEPGADGLGYWPLRVELADYLKRSRSVDCDPERVVIFLGTGSALDLITKLFIDQGDRVAVENPGFQHFRLLVGACKGEICPVAVDDHGLSTDQLNRLAKQPKMTCVTPTHQDPLGMPMSISRRQELLAWAITNKGMILENDVDSLFRYTTRPFPSLQGLDPSKNSVVYLSSFDKVLSPLIQLSFAVFPHSLLPLVANAKSMLQPHVPLIDQMVLADLIREGHLERHIRRSAVILSRRRNALITALTRRFGRKVWIARESAGTHIFIRLDTGWIDSALVQAANSCGLPLKSTREYYLSDRPPIGQFIASFASLDEAEADAIVEKFAQAIA